MDRLRFIPDPHAQERYLQGAVAAVLSQAHGRILRMLQQADMFKNITSKEGLLKVSPTSLPLPLSLLPLSPSPSLPPPLLPASLPLKLLA